MAVFIDISHSFNVSAKNIGSASRSLLGNSAQRQKHVELSIKQKFIIIICSEKDEVI